MKGVELSTDRRMSEVVAESLGIPSSALRFVDRVPTPAVATWLAAVDVGAMPYPATEHYATAMSPLKLFEYMAAGLPIVATDLPALREVLHDGDALHARRMSVVMLRVVYRFAHRFPILPISRRTFAHSSASTARLASAYSACPSNPTSSARYACRRDACRCCLYEYSVKCS